MPSERYFEILLSRCVKDVFGTGFELVSQQLTLPTGRVDLVLKEKNRQIHLVEVKKDRALKQGVNQVIDYVRAYNKEGITPAQGWIVANEINAEVGAYAKENHIRTLAIPQSNYGKIMDAAGLDESVLLGKRIQAGVLIGAGVQNFRVNAISIAEAIKELECPELRRLIEKLNNNPRFKFPSGKMQTKIVYRGIAMGGVNRGHKHSYISTNVVLNEKDTGILMKQGFDKKTKTQQSSSHVHVWWQTRLENTTGLETVIKHFSAKIDSILYS